MRKSGLSALMTLNAGIRINRGVNFPIFCRRTDVAADVEEELAQSPASPGIGAADR